MTDLAGFTSMMEKYEPAMLSSLLNEYLNSMIEVAFAHEGTLDRIVGDAVAECLLGGRPACGILRVDEARDGLVVR